jgi:hypothetical protein
MLSPTAVLMLRNSQDVITNSSFDVVYLKRCYTPTAVLMLHNSHDVTHQQLF